jgi:hypothetical protein
VGQVLREEGAEPGGEHGKHAELVQAVIPFPNCFED